MKKSSHKCGFYKKSLMDQEQLSLVSLRYWHQQANTATWSKISPSEGIYLEYVASSSCKLQQLPWMLKRFTLKKMKCQVNFLALFFTIEDLEIIAYVKLVPSGYKYALFEVTLFSFSFIIFATPWYLHE